MEVDLIFRIAAIGILVAVLNQVLIRAGRDEQALMTTLAGLAAVRGRLEELSVLARADSRRRGRVYEALGLSGGAFLVVLLL